MGHWLTKKQWICDLLRRFFDIESSGINHSRKTQRLWNIIPSLCIKNFFSGRFSKKGGTKILRWYISPLTRGADAPGRTYDRKKYYYHEVRRDGGNWRSDIANYRGPEGCRDSAVSATDTDEWWGRWQVMLEDTGDVNSDGVGRTSGYSDESSCNEWTSVWWKIFTAWPYSIQCDTQLNDTSEQFIQFALNLNLFHSICVLQSKS